MSMNVVYPFVPFLTPMKKKCEVRTNLNITEGSVKVISKAKQFTEVLMCSFTPTEVCPF